MKYIVDAKVDETDDLILINNEILLEDSVLQTNLNIAGRRIVGRYDDASLRDDLFAGLERFLFSKNIFNSVYDIKNAIVRCLARDGLFASNEYEVKITESTTPKEAKIYIIFKTPLLDNVKTFKIFIDVENQRVYRG